ncbi:phage tail protein [Paenibacillus kobensis]|uniref:phage tail protein n=1 Tax=Paenibacillus kobensis TaxID=59841 RepID=UPI000FD730CC|nr:tail fiber protein [Paenibacillus kobensis]
MADAFIGEIRMFAGNYPPNGWLFCDGSLLPIQRFTTLFSILGVMYGGDGKTTFALPNLTGRAPMHYGQGPGLTPRNQGAEDGSPSVTLNQSEIPAHVHVPQGGGSGNSVDPSGASWGGLGRTGTSLYADTPNVAMHPQAIQPTGGSVAHNNMQPYLACSFIICYNGEFPPRS